MFSDQDWQELAEHQEQRRKQRKQRMVRGLGWFVFLSFQLALMAFLVYRECHIWGWVE